MLLLSFSHIYYPVQLKYLKNPSRLYDQWSQLFGNCYLKFLYLKQKYLTNNYTVLYSDKFNTLLLFSYVSGP